jgi:CYTH domain-containing protein
VADGSHREVERKFLVDAVPDEVGAAPARRLRQGYLAGEGGVEVRIRDDAGTPSLTVKGGGGLTRVEVELALDPGQFEALWPLTEGRRVDKVRRAWPSPDGVVVELDEFDGPLAGVRVAEVEFVDEAAASAWTPPPWMGVELTGVRGWSNAELARHGRPADPPASGA